MLEVSDLKTYIETQWGTVRCVDGVSFELRRGETLGLVGESGCGKTMTAKSVLGLVDEFPGVVAGEVRFSEDGGEPAVNLTAGLGQHVQGEWDEQGEPVTLGKAWRRWRDLTRQTYADLWGKKMSIIFQDPLTSLNPYWTIGDQLMEAVRIGEGRTTPDEAVRQTALEWLQRVQIQHPDSILDAYPHQLSGGMSQRAMIAVALASRPEILVADEPTTGLDVTVQACIVDLLKELKADLGTTILLISHDMGLIGQLSDRIAVMYCGRMMECGPKDEILNLSSQARHPYTIALLESMPTLSILKGGERLQVIDSEVPDLLDPPAGCAFHPRCREYRDHVDELAKCTHERPGRHRLSDEHWVCCWAAMGGSPAEDGEDDSGRC